MNKLLFRYDLMGITIMIVCGVMAIFEVLIIIGGFYSNLSDIVLALLYFISGMIFGYIIYWLDINDQRQETDISTEKNT